MMTDSQQRRFTRISVTSTTTTLESDRGQVSGDVADQSIGGMGILVDDPQGLRLGDIVRLSHCEESGQIRHIAPTLDNRYRIGICWGIDEQLTPGPEDEIRTEEVEDLVALFVQVQELIVACESVQEEELQQYKVTLWNGRAFSVAGDRVLRMTRTQRRRELTPSNVDLLAKLYGGEVTEQLESVLDFEFRNAVTCETPSVS